MNWELEIKGRGFELRPLIFWYKKERVMLPKIVGN